MAQFAAPSGFVRELRAMLALALPLVVTQLLQILVNTTEVGMLGVLALRMQKPIVWDAAKRQAVGLPEADAIIDPKPGTNAYLPG